MLMEEKIILVTGSTDGIGFQTALDLTEMGYAVVIHGRTEEKCEAAANKIKKQTGGRSVDFIFGDYTSFAQVKSMADNFSATYQHLDVLINNAGIFAKEKELTIDGYETTFQINHLSHFLLTTLLLPRLTKYNRGRVVNVSSIAHRNAVFDIENLNGEKSFTGYAAYSLSKLCNIYYSLTLADQFGDSGVTSNALHPGVINTKLLNTGFGIHGASLKKGSEGTVFLAVSDEVRDINGGYFVANKLTEPSIDALDEFNRKELYDYSFEAIKEFLM